MGSESMSDTVMVDAGDSIFQQIHERDVRPWLDLVDELRAHGISQDLPLPQIAVMGDQSCGKSSVLEAISGIPFPRGSGLVTRCATQLIMKSAVKGAGWSATASIPEQRSRRSRGGGGSKSGGIIKKASSPEELTKVISDLQDALTGGDQGAFSTDTISIQVQAPGLPDLTLIDLPGIVRTTTKGQRATVMTEVNGLIEKYLQQERTIILAVVPSNQDVATVDILERAKIVDPEGDRTIGVLTKPDLIGPGNEDEAAAVLKNVRKPLKLGYVMVKCRSQKDIDQGMDNKEALNTETAFFRQHPVFKSLPSSYFGVPNLTKRLTKLLVGRIQAALPFIKWEIQSQLVRTDAQLKPMVKGVPQTTAECHTSLMKIVSDYCRLLRQSARGYYRDDILSAKPALRLHAATQAIFRQLHQNIAATVPGFNDSGFGERLAREISALKGREMPGFLNHQVFYGFMIQNVETWRPSVESCRTQAANAALTVASLLVETLAVQFPRLCSAVRDAIAALVEQLADEVSVRIDEIFQKESDPFTTNEGMLEVINTIRFRHFDKALEDAMDDAGETPENMEALKTVVMERLGEWYMRNHGVGTMANVEDMCTLLQAYWNVATKRLVDNVCMTMEQDFVVKLLGKVESELFLLTNRYTDVESLFLEDTSVVEKRRSMQAKKQRLLKGLETLMRMAPDVVAQRPGDLEDDWVAADGSDSAALLQQGNGRAWGSRDDPAEMRARSEEAALVAQAEGRSSNTDWSRTAWSRPAPTYSSSATNASTAPGFGGRQTPASPPALASTGSLARQSDQYNAPTRSQRQSGSGGGGGGAYSSVSGQQDIAAGAGTSRVRNGYGDQRSTPPSSTGGGTSGSSSAQNEQEVLVGRLIDMGFPRQKVEEALMISGGDADQAAERLMTQGDGGNAHGGASGARPTSVASSSTSRSPAPPSRHVRGLPAEFTQQTGHPATSSSGTGSTHFFRGSNDTGRESRTSRSPPAANSGDNTTEDRSWSDLLGSWGGTQGRAAGTSTSRSNAGNDGDRYGLFTDPSSSGTTGSRLSQSTSRYDTLFGDEEKKADGSTGGTRLGSVSRRRTNPSSLFGEDDH